MRTPVEISQDELSLFAEIVCDLSSTTDSNDPRPNIANKILQLFEADTLASYIWEADKKKYSQPVFVNHDSDNVDYYLQELQFNDPLTQRMRERIGVATLVEDAFPMHELSCTSFYQNFLQPADMYHGMNIFLPTQSGNTVDFRIWRRKDRPEFQLKEVNLLNVLATYLTLAMRRSDISKINELTERETEIAKLVARGLTDRDIANILKISFSTVRTHVNHCFEKLHCANRAELSSRLYIAMGRQTVN